LPREHYRVGVPELVKYREVMNSDDAYYSGSDIGNSGLIEAEAISWMNLPYSVEISLPPLAGIILVSEA
jgi:1,4-alpha-glucan branching enzyme